MTGGDRRKALPPTPLPDLGQLVPLSLTTSKTGLAQVVHPTWQTKFRVQVPRLPSVLKLVDAASSILVCVAGRVGLWKDIFTVSMNEKFDLVYKQKMGKCDLTFDFYL